MTHLHSYIYLFNFFLYKKNYYINTYKLFILSLTINKEFQLLLQNVFFLYTNHTLITRCIFSFKTIVLFFLVYSTFLELSILKYSSTNVPKKYKTFTVLKSPHTDKKSREQFHLIEYKKILKYPTFLSLSNSFLLYNYSMHSGIKVSNNNLKYVI